MDKIKIGRKVKFDSNRSGYSFGCKTWSRIVVGTITYINEPHNWFSVTYNHNNGPEIRTCFKFSDLGTVINFV